LPQSVDIIIDDRTCLVIRPASLLVSKEAATNFAINLLSIVSFETCWLILSFSPEKCSSPDRIISPLLHLIASLAGSLPQFIIRYSFNDEDTAVLVRSAAEESAHGNENWDKVSKVYGDESDA